MLLLFVAGVGSVNFCVVVCSGVCRVNVSVGSFNVVVVSLLVLAQLVLVAVVVLAVVAMVVLVSVCICGVDVLVGCFNDGASFGDYGGGLWQCLCEYC